jgi:hypothetical protein
VQGKATRTAAFAKVLRSPKGEDLRAEAAVLVAFPWLLCYIDPANGSFAGGDLASTWSGDRWLHAEIPSISLNGGKTNK